MSDLFRKEAVDHHRQRLFGEVIIAAPLSTIVITGLLGSIFVLILIALVVSDYSRKVTINGYLVPDQGIVRIYASSGGKIENLHVRENDMVNIGAPLITVNLDAGITNGRTLAGELLAQLEEEESAILAQRKLTIDEYQTRRTQLSSKIESLTAETAILNREISLHKDQLAKSHEIVAGYAPLVEKGISPLLEQKQREEKLIEKERQGQEAMRLLAQHQREISDLTYERDALTTQRQQALAIIGKDLAGLRQRQAEVTGRERIIHRAPVSGRIVTLQAREGQTADPAVMQLALLPEGSRLYAELYAPTHAAGFVKQGQPVRLLYDAFPYARFGAANGTVTEVSRTVIEPGELSGPISAEEPAFRVTVALESQSIDALGETFPLQAGATLKGDIILERRSLLDLLLEPLRATTER